MYPVGSESEWGLLIVVIILMNLISRKFLRSGVPRFRVIFLCLICIIFWICCLSLSFIDSNPVHSMLWMTLNVLSMAATLFVIFIAFFEILQNHGV